MGEMWMLGIVSLLVAAALGGLVYFRRRYFQLYQRVQLLQRKMLAGEDISQAADREGAEDVIRDGFVRIQKRYGREAEEAGKDREALKGLIQDLSHQLRTPLANIRLYQELLGKTELEPEQRARARRRLEEETDKLEWLLEALFKMVDLERGRGNLEILPAEIGHTVRQAAEAVRERARVRGIKIRFEGAFDLCLNHDPRWTQEVFFNLLENAVKYSPEGSTVTISCEAFETYGAVHIRDEGPGIPGEEIPRIFRKFYRGADTGQQEGWGIGLYLARLILEQEKGYVKVDSRPGEGSTFSVFLPLERKEAQEEK